MAEEKKQRRLVKNPETFRERAVKAAESGEKPHRIRRVLTVVAKPFKLIFRPIGRFIKLVFYRQPFLLLRRPLRIIGKVLLPIYIRNSWRELRQVNWPSWKQSRSLTLAVILFAVVFGLVIAGVDYGLDKLFRQILLK